MGPLFRSVAYVSLYVVLTINLVKKRKCNGDGKNPGAPEVSGQVHPVTFLSNLLWYATRRTKISFVGTALFWYLQP